MRRYRMRRRQSSSSTPSRQRRRDSARLQFLKALCEFDADKSLSQRDLGIHVYVDFIEYGLLELYATLEEYFRDLCGEMDTDESKLRCCLEICTFVLAQCRAGDTKTSIHDIARRLYVHYGTPCKTAARQTSHAYQIVFACIGWISMFFTPVVDVSCAEFCFSQQTLDSSGRRKISCTVERPVGAMLHALSLMPLHAQSQKIHASKKTELLAVCNLNFFILNRLGGLSVVWIDDLVSHCSIDLGRKELKLFRFPSYCSHIYNSDRPDIIIDHICRAHTCSHSCQTGGNEAGKKFLLEVLLTYRIIFGQDRRSRKVYRELIARRARSEGLYDPLLDTLCASRTIATNTMIHGVLKERSVYSSTADFTHLGARLAELQEYSLNQKPRGLMEVWNDHRDPHKSLTFWAVVVVGGCSIFLGLAQVLLAIAQLVVQIRLS